MGVTGNGDKDNDEVLSFYDGHRSNSEVALV